MKKLISIMLVLLVVFTFTATVLADTGTSILINGERADIASDMGSVKNISSRTFVPVRFVLEYFGFNVTWDGADQVVMGRNQEGDMFLMQVSNPVLFVRRANGESENITMDVSPFLSVEEGRTYIPVRFLAQAIGYKVGYDDATATVTLDK